MKNRRNLILSFDFCQNNIDKVPSQRRCLQKFITDTGNLVVKVLVYQDPGSWFESERRQKIKFKILINPIVFAALKIRNY